MHMKLQKLTCSRMLHHKICTPRHKFLATRLTVQWRIEHETPSFSWSERRQTSFLPTLWPPNSLDQNPVDLSIWSVGLLQEKAYRSRIANVHELKIRLIDEWTRLDQWRRSLNACAHMSGAHFETKS